MTRSLLKGSPTRWSPTRWSPIRRSPIAWSPVTWTSGLHFVCISLQATILGFLQAFSSISDNSRLKIIPIIFKYFSLAAAVSLVSVILVDLVGIKKMSTAFGMVLVAQVNQYIYIFIFFLERKFFFKIIMPKFGQKITIFLLIFQQFLYAFIK